MTQPEIKLLILEVIKDVFDNNTYYSDEGESFETNLFFRRKGLAYETQPTL